MRTAKYWQTAFVSFAAIMGVGIGAIVLNKKSTPSDTNPEEKTNFIGMPTIKKTPSKSTTGENEIMIDRGNRDKGQTGPLVFGGQDINRKKAYDVEADDGLTEEAKEIANRKKSARNERLGPKIKKNPLMVGIFVLVGVVITVAVYLVWHKITGRSGEGDGSPPNGHNTTSSPNYVFSPEFLIGADDRFSSGNDTVGGVNQLPTVDPSIVNADNSSPSSGSQNNSATIVRNYTVDPSIVKADNATRSSGPQNASVTIARNYTVDPSIVKADNATRSSGPQNNSVTIARNYTAEAVTTETPIVYDDFQIITTPIAINDIGRLELGCQILEWDEFKENEDYRIEKVTIMYDEFAKKYLWNDKQKNDLITAMGKIKPPISTPQVFVVTKDYSYRLTFVV